MIAFQKNKTNRQAFQALVQSLTKYEELGQDKTIKEKAIDLLAEEQKHLCPFCERRIQEDFIPTIEHFLPIKKFPELQLAYDNLYIACAQCNGPKADYLIPAYIFDERLNPANVSFLFDEREGLKIRYEIGSSECRKITPAANLGKAKLTSAYANAIIQHYSIELTAQNREKLLSDRFEIYQRIVAQIPLYSKQQLIAYWKKLTHPSDGKYEAFITLKLWLLGTYMKKKGINKAEVT